MQSWEHMEHVIRISNLPSSIGNINFSCPNIQIKVKGTRFRIKLKSKILTTNCLQSVMFLIVSPNNYPLAHLPYPKKVVYRKSKSNKLDMLHINFNEGSSMILK